MNGHDETIETLNRYRPAVLAFMRRFGFSKEDAEDLTQTVFMRVCQSVESYRGEAVVNYLTKIAKRIAINAIRDRHAKKRTGIEVSEDEASAVPDKRTPSAHEKLEAKESSERLRRAVQQLEPHLKVIVLLSLADLPHAEIARIEGLTESAVKSRLHAARKKLTELMGEDVNGPGGV